MCFLSEGQQMLRFSAAAVLAGIFITANLAASEQAEKAAAAFPKVPSRALILKDNKDGDAEGKRVSDWVQTFIEAKEKKARAELEVMRVKLKQESVEREGAEKERRRREDRQNQRWGTLGGKALPSENRKNDVRMMLDFLVPEVETYRATSDVYRFHQALCNDIVEALSKLDRDGDGRLTVDEYRDVAAILASTIRLFQNFDKNNDGMLSEGEVEGMQNIPANAAAAIRLGRPSDSVAETIKIKAWDTDGNGELDVTERKALSMSFVNQSLRAGENAAFYKNVADKLASARDVVAAKFAGLEILP